MRISRSGSSGSGPADGSRYAGWPIGVAAVVTAAAILAATTVSAAMSVTPESGAMPAQIGGSGAVAGAQAVRIRPDGPSQTRKKSTTSTTTTTTIAVGGATTTIAIPTDAATTTTSTTTTSTTTTTAPTTTTTTAAPRPVDSDRVVGYVTSWGVYDRNFQMADIPAARLTHVNYAFANVVNGRCAIGDAWADIQRPLATDDLSLPYRGNFNQLQVLKRKHPHLRVLLSVGGWTWSGGFSAAASTATGRDLLAASCVEMMERYGFDGLDIDWEYPVSGGLQVGRAADKQNYPLLLQNLRTRLETVEQRTGTERLLTIAGPGGPTTMANFDIPATMAPLDWVNVMSYDFAGDWSPRTGHNAPLYSYPGIEDPTFTLDSAMRRWVAAGAVQSKLNGGLAFYGRGFGGVTTAAPGGTFRSVPMGTSQAGQFDYWHLTTSVLGSMTITFDEQARVPYAFNPSTGVWMSYDDPRSIADKAAYLDANGYGGAMIWELSNDSNSALLDAVARGFGG